MTRKNLLIVMICVVICAALLMGCAEQAAEEPAAEPVSQETAEEVPEETPAEPEPEATEPEPEVTEPTEIVSGGESGIMYTDPGEEAAALFEQRKGYKKVTTEDNAVLAALPYPVYFNDVAPYNPRYAVWGVPVDADGNETGDGQWYVLPVRASYVFREETGEYIPKTYYVFHDAFGNTEDLPSDAETAIDYLVPAQLGFTIKATLAPGDEIADFPFYAFADAYDAETGDLIDSKWIPVDVVSEKISEKGFSAIIDGQEVYFKNEDGKIETSFVVGMEDPYYLPFDTCKCYTQAIDISYDVALKENALTKEMADSMKEPTDTIIKD